jgi:hypothetical protein
MIASQTFWETIVDLDRADLEVAALWLLLHDALPTGQLLRFQASGSWACLGHGLADCGPDGIPTLRLHADCLLLPGAPAGALIGKLGGSSIGRDDGKTFAIGSFCVHPALDKAAPLFVAVNGASPATGYRLSQLKLSISGSDPSSDAA